MSLFFQSVSLLIPHVFVLTVVGMMIDKIFAAFRGHF